MQGTDNKVRAFRHCSSARSRHKAKGRTFGPFASLKYVGLKLAPGLQSSDVFSFLATYVSSFFPPDVEPVKSPSILLLPVTDAYPSLKHALALNPSAQPLEVLEHAREPKKAVMQTCSICREGGQLPWEPPNCQFFLVLAPRPRPLHRHR